MGVVIVQSRATAHVYRIFGALVVLLVVMALAVAALRFRSGHQDGTPYGALSSLNVKPDQAPPPLPAAALPASAQAGASAPAAPANPEVPAPDGAARAPRVIALDKAAAGSAVPQPAPPAVVEAATRAAAAPPPPAPVPAPAPTVAPLPAAPAVVAAAQPSTNPPPPPGGRININTASADQLNRLGAGMIGAWIIRHRPYRSVDDLLSRRVLKSRDFGRIQGAITTD